MNFYLIILFFIAFRIKINIYKYLYIINLYIVCQSRPWSHIYSRKKDFYICKFWESLFVDAVYNISKYQWWSCIFYAKTSDKNRFLLTRYGIHCITTLWDFFFAHREINPYNDVFSIYSAIKMIDCFLYAHIGLSN